jgi:tetratricopeptide (TPR) repeat protein
VILPRSIAALLLVGFMATGAFYEWGGPAARGIRELREGKAPEATVSLREAHRERPRSAAIRFDQALAFQAAGLVDSANAAYQNALELEGAEGRAAAAFNRANAALQAGRLDDAIADYRRSLREEPHRQDAKRNLEEALRRARDAKPPRLAGDSGTRGGGSGGTGRQQGGSAPPPPGGEREPSPSNAPPGGQPPPPQLGAPLPSKAEAEHWLDALEAERRAGRSREQAAKRSSQRGGRPDRDW